jgi:ribonuclease HII
MARQQRLVTVSADALVAGVDEAGRGPLAGPVVAAAVILDGARPIGGLADSKQLTARRREAVALAIRQQARAFGIGVADPAEIDDINILQATLRAMERAVAALQVAPELVQVDGDRLPRFRGLTRPVLAEPVVGGDRVVPAISAASIIAKVHRDSLMEAWHERYPQYGFHQHKGYATRGHLQALDRHGACPIHRRSFAPVRDLVAAGRVTDNPDES